MSGPRIIVVWIAWAAGLAAGARGAEQQWYVMLIDGRRCGVMRQTVEREGVRVATVTQVKMAIRRGEAKIEIEMGSRFVETEAGRAIEAHSSQKLAGQAVETSIEFKPEGRVVTTRQFGQSRSTTLPAAEGGWLAPQAALEHVRQRMRAGDATIRYRMIDPSISPDVFEVTHQSRGEEPIDVYGRTVPSIKRVTRMSILPGVETVEHVDERGELLRSTMDLGGMKVEVVAADRQLAESELDAPELLVATLIRPDFVIHDPRRLKRATFELGVKSGAMPQVPSSASQRVKVIDERRVEVEIDASGPWGEAGQAEPAIEHTAMIDGRDERVRVLAEESLKGMEHATTEQKAEAMRRFVHRHVDYKDLSVGMASASETARTKVGDCTEHGVLLAAMLKAVGIPARAASGLVYVQTFAGQQQVMGYHLWTQAWIDGKWRDLDATADEDSPFDATHILLSTSNLGDAEMVNDMMRIAPVLGNLTVKMKAQP